MSLYNADVLACNRIASLAARVYRFARRLWSRHRDEEQRAGTMPTTDALATAARLRSFVRSERATPTHGMGDSR